MAALARLQDRLLAAQLLSLLPLARLEALPGGLGVARGRHGLGVRVNRSQVLDTSLFGSSDGLFFCALIL